MLPTSKTAEDLGPKIINVHPDPMMAESFLRKLYAGAPRGYLTVVRKQDGLMLTDFIDISFVSMDNAAVRACKFATAHDVYFGVGLRAEKLDTRKRGDADSVIVIPGLWIDCDIKGPAHKETALPPDEKAAMLVLRGAEIEPTLVVNSGHGLHGYYLLNQPLAIDEENRERVKTLMAGFHGVTAAVARQHGWKLDNTAELARILRPAGTVNRKDPQNPKPVTFEDSKKRYEFAEIEEQVRSRSSHPTGRGFVGFEGFAAQPAAISKPPLNASSTEVQAQGYSAAVEVPPSALAKDFPPALIEPIVKGCVWMRHCRDDADMLSEPEWYAMLSVLGRCEDGERLAHEWSRPYPKYTFGETDRKLRHALEDAGPVTCARVMDGLGQQEFCGECLCRDYVKSPISLGAVELTRVEPFFPAPAPVETAASECDLAAPTSVESASQEQAPEPQPQAPEPAAQPHAVPAPGLPTPQVQTGPPWPVPKVLKTALPPVPAFNPDLLPSAFRDYAVDVAERMQVPLDFAAAALIVSLAGAVGRRAMITPKRRDLRWNVVPNMWGGIVSRPGNLKSPLINEILRPLRKLQKAALEAHKAAMEEYEQELEAWDARKKKAHKNCTDFDEPKPQRPPGLRFLVNDATIEKLHAILEDNPQGVLLVRDEMAGWLATMETKGRERERPFFLEAWNGDGSYTIDRIGRGTLHVEYLCLSVFGGIQPAILQNYLTDAVNGGGNDDGLVQRLQVLVWPDQDTEWQNIDRPANSQASDAVERLFLEIAAMPVAEPLQMRFSPDAQELFDCWRGELEQRVRKGKLPRFLESHLAKYRSLMPSIALLLHIADGSREPEVPLIQAQRAAQWCDYLEAHALRVYSCVTNAPVTAAATLGEKIQKGVLQGPFTARDVYMKNWSKLTTPDQAHQALAVLQEAAWVRVHSLLPGRQGGRPTEVYEVNPGIRHE